MAISKWRDRPQRSRQRLARSNRLTEANLGENMTPEQIFHIYRDLCPDEDRPNQRDPDCPACQLLLDYDRLTAGLSVIEKRWREASRDTCFRSNYRQTMELCADELAELLRGD